MKFKRARLSSFVLVSLLVISIFTLFFTASISYKQLQTVTESESLITHSYKIYVLLEQLEIAAKDAETNQRGFLLTSDSSFVLSFYEAIANIDTTIFQLKTMMSDNSQQTRLLDTLTSSINERITNMNKVLERNDFTISSTDSIKGLILKGSDKMKLSQSYIDDMVANELQLLKAREKVHENDIKLSPFTILFIVIFSLIIFISAFYRINKDLKGLAITNKLIEEKLADLERSNAQLSTFNHIASHDLQEPVRKIQTFISRIGVNDLQLIPEKVRDYLTGIGKAADRMSKFIEDLLLYSRANKTDKDYEPANLNEILENAKRDLSQMIDEKHVIINANNLPTVNVIPFQIQQLFNNLILNSIKYSKPGTDPVISIDSKLAVGKEIPDPQGNNDKIFHKISISDNGIGFDQRYAEKIFELFFRLHTYSEYSGTGIGLSICKIIVENHKGFIKAEGHPQTGSTFIIYLPA